MGKKLSPMDELAQWLRNTPAGNADRCVTIEVGVHIGKPVVVHLTETKEVTFDVYKTCDREGSGKSLDKAVRKALRQRKDWLTLDDREPSESLAPFTESQDSHQDE